MTVMPISPIVLQRRHAELGRIRLGNKGDRGQPQKLQSFRFTSHSEGYIRDLAELYGGEARPWDNGGVASWEVYTTAKSIPVIAVKGGLSQWLEFWQGGGCIHRCDGENNVLTGEACDHDEQVKTRVRGQDVWVNPHAEAKPTTRLSLMLPELEAIGVWRLESHGWNAAAEIPAVAELAQFVGDLVPANLHLVERRVIKDGRTSRFVVPVLDLQIGTSRLREIVAAKSGAGEIAAVQERAAIAAGPTSSSEQDDRYADFFAQVESATTLDELAGIWDLARDNELVGQASEPTRRRGEFEAAWKAKAHEINDRQKQQTAGEAPVDAELVDEGDADQVWGEILRAAGSLQPPMTEDQVKADVHQVLGVAASIADASELREYLKRLQQKTGAAA